MKKNNKKININGSDVFKDKNLGVKIDLGAGETCQPGWIGVDFRKHPGISVVQNLKLFPWREIPDECASLVMASHLLEHITKDSSNPQLSALIHLLEKKGLISEKEVAEQIGDHQFLSTFGRFMDEVWRITKFGGQFMIAVPYAGSHGFHQDPSHTTPLNETTFTYFDPLAKNPDGTLIQLYTIYRFKPWKIVSVSYNMGGNMEVLLEKRLVDASYRVEDNSNVK